ncbi:MAG: ribonuclease R [Candidatus Pelagibacter sp.]|nr:ribonuclease R [Candidatus Pelagibacter sp.]
MYKNKKNTKHSEKEKSTHIIQIGIISIKGERCLLEPLSHKRSFSPITIDINIIKSHKIKLEHHDIVSFESYGISVTILDKISHIDAPHAYSLLALTEAGISPYFPQKCIDSCSFFKTPSIKDRKDYRDIFLVTIDGEDARDFDDAVYARPDDNKNNPGGYFIIVAIADVTHFIKERSILDQEAQKRGNSIYFADRVVPMLPEKLSNDLCSLRPHEERACLAVEMRINSDGKLLEYQFFKGLMKSHARLTYNEVNTIISKTTNPKEFLNKKERVLWDESLKHLYDAYNILKRLRNQRGSLNITSQEKKIKFNDEGQIKEILWFQQLESHQIIEEMMILANVAAALKLSKAQKPTLYRVHPTPDESRVTNLFNLAQSLGYPLKPKSKANVHVFNNILSHPTHYRRMMNDLVLRTQAQAIYTPFNKGHFGLGLQHYCHFTSPIRRYADIIVHRGLNEVCGFDKNDKTNIKNLDHQATNQLEELGSYISATERKAAVLEREVMDRYLVKHLESRVGESFKALIVGVNQVGIFFELEKTGAQGFIHRNDLGDDFYVFDEKNHCFFGKRKKQKYQLGMMIQVLLESADAKKSKTLFKLIHITKENRSSSKLSKLKLNNERKAAFSKRKPSSEKKQTEKFPKRKPITEKTQTEKFSKHKTDDQKKNKIKTKDSSAKPLLKFKRKPKKK